MEKLRIQYQEQGYAVLEGVISQSAIDSVLCGASRIVDEFDINAHHTIFSTRDRDRGRDDYFMQSAEAVHCFLEEDALDTEGNLVVAKDQSINKIGHAMHDLVPEFSAFCRQPFFARCLHSIGYQDPVLWQTMYLFKHARIGGEVRWHQDASYLHTKPSSVVGFWVALEDAHRENGCLWVQPGGHRSPLREIYEVDHRNGTGTLRELDDTPWPSFNDGIAVEVPAGSLVIFNDHMPHFSSQNHSENSRQAFSMHFAEASANWPAENWLQRHRLGHFRI
jgi:phytanoyl-CoA hydroxylase